MGWATFWAFFSQTHLVALLPGRVPQISFEKTNLPLLKQKASSEITFLLILQTTDGSPAQKLGLF
jgi:hypothetical protein